MRELANIHSQTITMIEFSNMDNYFPHHPAQLPEDLRAYAREMRMHMTDAEALLWKLLRNRRIADAKFRRQHPIGRYILDFYCDEKKLVIELDGSQHMDAVNYDQQRDGWLKAQGIRVLRFWNNQVLIETESVMEVIYEAVAPADALSPNPSPASGRGEPGIENND